MIDGGGVMYLLKQTNPWQDEQANVHTTCTREPCNAILILSHTHSTDARAMGYRGWSTRTYYTLGNIITQTYTQCVCVCVNMYTYIPTQQLYLESASIHTDIIIILHVCMRTYCIVNVYIYKVAYIHTNSYTYIELYVCIHNMYLYTCTYIHLHVGKGTINIHIQIQKSTVYTHIHTYTCRYIICMFKHIHTC